MYMVLYGTFWHLECFDDLIFIGAIGGDQDIFLELLWKSLVFSLLYETW